jgi:hypothetical protein
MSEPTRNKRQIVAVQALQLPVQPLTDAAYSSLVMRHRASSG